jgi:hypothetical protein
MANRIREVRITQPKWDPGSAELWISLVADFVTPATEMRGRLVGPRCVYSTTVEVAYPFRPLARRPEGIPGITQRVIIPEASLWEPECPFLYEGTVELWQDGQHCDQAPARHGLRLLQLNSSGLRLNGNKFALSGKRLSHLFVEQVATLRKAGINTVCLPINQDAEQAYDVADRLGMFILGRDFSNVDGFDLALSLKRHPSCLGWFLSPYEIEKCMGQGSDWPARAAEWGSLIIAQLDKPPTHPLPDWVSAVACEASNLAKLGSIHKPKVMVGMQPTDDDHSQKDPNGPVIGWIQ